MKKLLFLSSLLFLVTAYGIGQINCSKYYPFEEGTNFQYTTSNKKGKVEGTADYKVTNVSNAGSESVAEMSISFKDKKQEEIFISDYKIICTATGVKIDFESLMPAAMLEQYKDMDVDMDITGTDIELPNELAVGQDLADANVTMTVNMSGIKMKTIVNMIHRKVEKKEQVTTSSGTYDCYVIYSENESQVMGMKKIFPSRLWLAEGVGMVKQESYKKGGDLMSSTTLTAFSKK